jgi:c-di-GMP-binding flagellar brake protein YcgR
VDTVDSTKKEAKTHYGILNFERRKYPRFSVDLPVEYYRTDKAGGSLGQALDDSKGGLLIYFSERMELGQCLRLRLFFSMGSKVDSIELLAEVAWVDMGIGEDLGDYRTGVKIVDISPNDMTKLNNFLMSL